MNDTKLTLAQIEPFLNGTQSITFTPASKEACYAEVARKLKQWNYFKLSKKKKIEIREYLLKRTGYSRSQLTRLIAQYRQKKWIGKRRYQRHRFSVHYTQKDILLLARTDECHQTLSGAATRKLFERAYQVFNDTAYERLSEISVAHIYNLRKSRLYAISPPQCAAVLLSVNGANPPLMANQAICGLIRCTKAIWTV